jgi:hypothetical protein
MISYRYLPAIRSAALRNMAARSEKGRDSQAGLAASAASIAADTSEVEAFEYDAIVEEWLAGFCWVDMDDVLIYRNQYSISKSETSGLLLFLRQQEVPPTETSFVSSQVRRLSLLAEPTLSHRSATYNQQRIFQLA